MAVQKRKTFHHHRFVGDQNKAAIQLTERRFCMSLRYLRNFLRYSRHGYIHDHNNHTTKYLCYENKMKDNHKMFIVKYGEDIYE